ncbi:uncharacterized protein LACBIDRAFT_331628, partial [Laccaria bicolor S238N-H82]
PFVISMEISYRVRYLTDRRAFAALLTTFVSSRFLAVWHHRLGAVLQLPEFFATKQPLPGSMGLLILQAQKSLNQGHTYSSAQVGPPLQLASVIQPSPILLHKQSTTEAVYVPATLAVLSQAVRGDYSRLKAAHIFPRAHNIQWVSRGFPSRITDPAPLAEVGGPAKFDSIQNVLLLPMNLVSILIKLQQRGYVVTPFVAGYDDIADIRSSAFLGDTIFGLALKNKLLMNKG